VSRSFVFPARIAKANDQFHGQPAKSSERCIQCALPTAPIRLPPPRPACDQ
jgi:hypothetical protein